MWVHRFDDMVSVYWNSNPLHLYFVNVPYPYLFPVPFHSNSSCFDFAFVVFPFFDSFAGDYFVFVVEMDH